jgi:hypothetical protein
MRILIINTADLDFVNNKEDYRTLLEIISKPYPTGIHRIEPAVKN